MLRQFLATTAILVLLGGSAFAQSSGDTAADQTTAPAQTGAAAGSVEPEPEKATGTTHTGGVTSTAREIIPDTLPAEQIGGPAAVETAAPEIDQASPSAGGAGTPVVDESIIRELRQMALEADKKSVTPAPVKSEEAKKAEQEAIERHRTALFARVDERINATE